MGMVDSMLARSVMRWVWEANRGSPVRLNATLTFWTNGNLVLADSDGRIAWQTNTANKGVVGLKLLSSGNMVLHDAKGHFIWQSFDYPTDTLLVGQSIRLGGVRRLVSRASVTQNKNGPYSLEIERQTLGMYYKGPNSPTPLRYFSFSDILTHLSTDERSVLQGVTFGPRLDLMFNVSTVDFPLNFTMRRPRYNTTYSYLRLGIDGNLRYFTYQDNVRRSAWEETMVLFDRASLYENECQLPEKCGRFGLCENNQCVACPLANGFFGWTSNCKPQKVNSCAVKNFRYYGLKGVDHFMSKYNEGEGPMKQSACLEKCNNDCKCVGYFYHTKESRCWVAYDLQTLTKVANSTHLAFIKAPLK